MQTSGGFRQDKLLQKLQLCLGTSPINKNGHHQIVYTKNQDKSRQPLTTINIENLSCTPQKQIQKYYRKRQKSPQHLHERQQVLVPSNYIRSSIQQGSPFQEKTNKRKADNPHQTSFRSIDSRSREHKDAIHCDSVKHKFNFNSNKENLWVQYKPTYPNNSTKDQRNLRQGKTPVQPSLKELGVDNKGTGLDHSYTDYRTKNYDSLAFFEQYTQIPNSYRPKRSTTIRETAQCQSIEKSATQQSNLVKEDLFMKINQPSSNMKRPTQFDQKYENLRKKYLQQPSFFQQSFTDSVNKQTKTTQPYAFIKTNYKRHKDTPSYNRNQDDNPFSVATGCSLDKKFDYGSSRFQKDNAPYAVYHLPQKGYSNRKPDTESQSINQARRKRAKEFIQGEIQKKQCQEKGWGQVYCQRLADPPLTISVPDMYNYSQVEQTKIRMRTPQKSTKNVSDKRKEVTPAIGTIYKCEKNRITSNPNSINRQAMQTPSWNVSEELVIRNYSQDDTLEKLKKISQLNDRINSRISRIIEAFQSSK